MCAVFLKEGYIFFLKGCCPMMFELVLDVTDRFLNLRDTLTKAKSHLSFRITMSVIYNKELTALLVIDPYNDFISEGGKLWDRLKGVAEANHCVPNMWQVLNAARKAELRVFYALHHRYRPGDYETWKYIAPIQQAAWLRKTFEYGTWGGEIRREFEPQPGEIVAQEHWGSSGFANTDLDLQLKRHGIHQLIVIGLIAHTCVEATVRYAAELGYEVTVVKDATASYSDEHMHASLDINIPNYASAIVTTTEIVDSISSL
jgi:ureidoacrylate peracid hydrolase